MERILKVYEPCSSNKSYVLGLQDKFNHSELIWTASSVKSAMDQVNEEAATREKWIVCIILSLLCTRDLRKKVGLLAV